MARCCSRVEHKPSLNFVGSAKFVLWQELSGILMAAVPIVLTVLLVWALTRNLLNDYAHSLLEDPNLTDPTRYVTPCLRSFLPLFYPSPVFFIFVIE